MMAEEFTLVVATGNDTRTFLPTMLQRVEPEEGDLRGMRMTKDGENATLILRTVLKNGSRRKRVVHAHGTYTPSPAKEKSFRLFNDILEEEKELGDNE